MNTKIKLFIITLFTLCFVHQGNSQNSYYLQTGLTDVADINNWTDDPLGGPPTTPPTDFLNGFDTWNVVNNPSASYGILWDVEGTVIVGDGATATILTALFGSSLPNADEVTISAGSTFEVDESSLDVGLINGSAFGSTVIFGANGPSSIEPGSYYNVELNKAMTIGGGASASTFIDGTLTMNPSSTGLTISSSKKVSVGAIAGTGFFNGSGTSTGLTINGPGGTLRTSGSFGSITIDLDNSTDVVTLGTNLTQNVAAGAFALTTGILNLGGFNLTSSGIVTFGTNGRIGGHASSALSFNSTGTFSGSMMMDATNNSLKSLTLNRTSRTLTLGNTLNILDHATVTAGILASGVGANLILKATSTLKGRLGIMGAGGSITGNITAETFVPGGLTGWANWGANGVAGQAVSNWASQIPMVCQGCPNGVTSAGGSYFESVLSWFENSGVYDTTLTFSTGLITGKGYWVYVGSGQTNTTDYTLVHTGAPIQAAQSIGMTIGGAGAGLNLVANPYASPISWTAVRALTGTSNVANAIYIWNADNNNYTTFTSGVIPAGQAFYVYASANANLLFNESVKSTANTGSNPLLKENSSANGDIFRLKLTGSNNDGDEMTFRIHSLATPGFDNEYDAFKLFQTAGYVGYPGSYSKYTTISSKDPQGVDYSIHSIGALTQSVTIPVLARGMATGSYTIEAMETENIRDCIMLKDNLTNTVTDLKMNSYVFNLNDTTSTPRFELQLCKSELAEYVGIEELKGTNTIFINQDAQGAYVNTEFAQNTKATISAYNIIGQKLMEDVQVEGTVTSTRLNLNTNNQVVLIRVTTPNEVATKKLIAH